MEPAVLSANVRSDRGKGAARRLRHTDRIPGVAYGKDVSPVALDVAPKELLKILTSAYGQNSVIKLELDTKESLNVIVADYQYHPVTRSLLHVDFKAIDLTQPVDIEVPLELTGKPKGVVVGGDLRQVYRRLPVRCLPEKVPVSLSADVTELDLDDQLPAKDVALPEGVELRLPPQRTIALVIAGRRAKAAASAEEGEGEEAAEEAEEKK